MLTPSDFLHIPFTTDLSAGGIAYACQELARSYDRMGNSPIHRLRSMVGEVAVELAFRRYLGENKIPFQVFDSMPFTRPKHYDILLGGHRAIIRSSLITRRNQVAQLKRDPAFLLQAPALNPMEEFAVEGYKPDDLYLFAFFLGTLTDVQAGIDKALSASQPVYLIHPMPQAWAKPAIWALINKLVLKSECKEHIGVEIGGMDAGRNFLTIRLELPPRQRVQVEQSFHSLAYLHVERRPEARIGIYSPVFGEVYLIDPNKWDNLWIDGMEILFTGWLTHEEFQRKARVLNAGAHTFQVDRLQEKNLLVPTHELNPLPVLLDKVKTWEMEKRGQV